MKPLRIGVAGLGFGAAIHVPGFRAIEGVEVVAIAGSTRERAKQVADRLGIQNACAGFAELLELPLDAVAIALPPAQNELAAGIAIDRGIPLFLEKPVASSAKAARELAASAKDRGVVTAVDLQFAEIQAFQALKRAVEQGSLGRVKEVSVTWRMHSYSQRNKKWGWKTDAERFGGVTLLLGSHVFYLAEWLFGPISSLSAILDRKATECFAPAGARPAEDGAQIRGRLEAGQPISIQLTNSDPSPPLHQWRVELERGSLLLENPTADPLAGFTLTARDQSGKVLRIEDGSVGSGLSVATFGNIDAFASLAGRFVTGVRKNEPLNPDLACGARVQTLLDAVFLAAREGGTLATGGF